MAAPTGLTTQAQTGFAKSAAYDKYRPSFPAETVDALLENLRVNDVPGSVVVDLAAGTGKFTELLADRPEQYKIIAVEPHDGMRKVLAEKCLKNVEVKEGLSTSIPLKDESVDAIIAAQAFHWFANEESLKEMHRVLQPHGALGLVWNIEDYNAPRSHQAASSWEAKMHDLIWSFDDNLPRFRHEKWRKVFDKQLKSNPLSIATSAEPLFSLPLGERVQKWQLWLSKDLLWNRISTLSQIAVLETEATEKVYKVFSDAVDAPDVEKNEKGEIALHGETLAYWTTKVPSDGARALISDVIDAVTGKS